ncbi:unnamed protein product, partial [Brassica oleracea var. botrytis]
DEVTNSSVEISLRDQVWLEWKKLRLRQGRLMTDERGSHKRRSYLER